MKTPQRLLLIVAIVVAATAAARAQIAQPYLTSITPAGVKRGGKVTITVDGFNLTDATEVLWSKPGVTSTIVLNAELARETPRPSKDPTRKLIGDRGTRNRLTIESTIAPDAEVGFYNCRIRTPLGTTNLGRVYIGALPEIREREMNDSAADAQPLSLPATVVGAMEKIGDSDCFKFKARAGQEMVFEIISAALNSRLDSVLTLLDENGRTLATNNDHNGGKDSLLAHRFKQEGEFVIRVSDLERKGQMAQYEYRLNIGELPLITDVFPLGVRQGTAGEIAITGFNLGTARATVNAPNIAGWNATTRLKLDTPLGGANTVKLAAGRYPEMMENAARASLAAPQTVNIPVTINGRIRDGEDFYRFRARKGQRLTLEIEAQRFGSPLDAVIEVLDAEGAQLPRVIARCLLETQLTLNDRDSVSRGFRLLNWNGINVDDYLLAGNELTQVEVLPKGPDEDTFLKSFLGQRLAFEDTTPEAHAANSTAYKVSLHAPGARLAPNGLPVVTIHYRNDDGGPMYGKDSRLNFVAPQDGEYIVRVGDVRGMHGERFAYRLSIHEPSPNYVIFADPENPNIPRGSSVPVTITAYRADGFDGPINVQLLDLPAGFSATTGVIPSGQHSTVIMLTAANDANASFPLRIQATADINGRSLTRELNTEERVAVASVAPPPELLVWTEPAQVTLEPGGHAYVTIKIKREREFTGRVLFDARNLPHGVIITDVGLNGVMIPEEETTQRFRLAAEPWVNPMEQPVFVVGRIETASPQRSDFPAKPFKLIIRSKETRERKAVGGRR
ncbi:MAG: hypothetical protein ACREAB_13460 [Blastocatellia bacterium]